MDNLFGFDNPSMVSEDLELIATVYDNVRRAVVESLLRDAQIPFVTKERGSGSAVKIIMGFSIYAADIYVERERLDEADAVLAPVFAENEEDDSEICADELYGDDDLELDEESEED